MEGVFLRWPVRGDHALQLREDRLSVEKLSSPGLLNAAFEFGFELAKGALSFTFLTLKQAKRFPNYLAGGLTRFDPALKERVELRCK